MWRAAGGIAPVGIAHLTNAITSTAGRVDSTATKRRRIRRFTGHNGRRGRSHTSACGHLVGGIQLCSTTGLVHLVSVVRHICCGGAAVYQRRAGNLCTADRVDIVSIYTCSAEVVGGGRVNRLLGTARRFEFRRCRIAVDALRIGHIAGHAVAAVAVAEQHHAHTAGHQIRVDRSASRYGPIDGRHTRIALAGNGALTWHKLSIVAAD